jgi:recombinational DNA repair protein (RecF pathway)
MTYEQLPGFIGTDRCFASGHGVPSTAVKMADGRVYCDECGKPTKPTAWNLYRPHNA